MTTYRLEIFCVGLDRYMGDSEWAPNVSGFYCGCHGYLNPVMVTLIPLKRGVFAIILIIAVVRRLEMVTTTFPTKVVYLCSTEPLLSKGP